jgi:plasmid stabilization system protein ParE
MGVTMTEGPHEQQEDIVWFSRFFGVDQPQYELPFVDFSLHSDVPLYIDPYAITKDPTEFAARCHNAIFSYFELLLETIRTGSRTELRRLVRDRLTEPSEIHLGVSQVARRGRGIGVDQEQQVLSALADSAAAQAGVIQAIQELELHILGIGPDKISDLIANIILGYLARYTERICRYYGIATRPCAVSTFWNEDRQEWDGGYFNLPVYGTHSYILVPKRFVRRERDLMNHTEFYNKYVLEVLQRELLDAGDSLVQTLKSGRRRVTKKDLKEDGRFPGTKDFISRVLC